MWKLNFMCDCHSDPGSKEATKWTIGKFETIGTFETIGKFDCILDCIIVPMLSICNVVSWLCWMSS